MKILAVKFLSLVVVWLFIPAATMALPVEGLYSHEVAVVNQSDAERNRAFREALEAVLVKVTGDPGWLQNSRLQQALSSAQDFVEAIEYRSEIVPVTDVDADVTAVALPQMATQEYINVAFARSLIDPLLANAAIPVWDSNRPSVLVWMALQDDSGSRLLLSEETNADIITFMEEFSSERGIPIMFPVLDFEDSRNLNADMIWSLDDGAVTRASERYAPDSILVGRLHMASTGELVGLWQFIFQDQIEVFDSVNTDLRAYIDEPLDAITRQLAEHFSIVASLDGNQKVRLRIEGIRSLSAYAELSNYLQSLVLVDRVAVAHMQGDILELDLTLLGSQQQLGELLGLDRNLLPLEQPLITGSAFLSYRWTQ